MSAIQKIHGPVIDTLRITKREWLAIVNDLDKAQKKPPSQNKRADKRTPFLDNAAVLIELQHPGGSHCLYLARPRDISPKGLGFLHGQYLYPGSKAVVTIVSRHGASVRVAGKIVRCRLLQGKIHEVGLSFNESIEVKTALAAPAA